MALSVLLPQAPECRVTCVSDQTLCVMCCKVLGSGGYAQLCSQGLPLRPADRGARGDVQGFLARLACWVPCLVWHPLGSFPGPKGNQPESVHSLRRTRPARLQLLPQVSVLTTSNLFVP